MKRAAMDYLNAVALAHMLSDPDSGDEDALADILNRGTDEGRWTEAQVDDAQRWACGNGPWTIGTGR